MREQMMVNIFDVNKTARRKPAYEIALDLRIETKKKKFRAISLVEPVPMDILMGAAFIKIRGKMYKFYYEHDSLYGFGMDDAPGLPGSLVGEMVEFIHREDSIHAACRANPS